MKGTISGFPAEDTITITALDSCGGLDPGVWSSTVTTDADGTAGLYFNVGSYTTTFALSVPYALSFSDSGSSVVGCCTFSADHIGIDD